MGYSKMLENPNAQPRGGYVSRFPAGMANPSVGGINRPTGRMAPGGAGGGGGIATVYSTSPGPAPVDPWAEYQARKAQGPTSTHSGGSVAVQGQQKKPKHVGFNEPDIPGMRGPFDVERYTGEKWAPSEGYASSVVDTGALIEATDKLLQERMGGEMAEAARRFGQAGALMSGGGLGGGYAGTLGESERGYRRDYGEMAHRYRFQAEQADAERKQRAYSQAMDRELRGHEGYEGRRLQDVEMGNKYGSRDIDRMTDYDWDKYDAELGAAGRAQKDAIAEMLAQYGM